MSSDVLQCLSPITLRACVFFLKEQLVFLIGEPNKVAPDEGQLLKPKPLVTG